MLTLWAAGFPAMVLNWGVVLGVMALVACGLAIGWILGGNWRGRTAGRRSRKRNQRALAGEREAEQLLVEFGFFVLEKQAVGIWWMEIDGELAEVEVRADLLVEEVATGRQFVAEVKTGNAAPDPLFAATRRQLLEYSLVFDPMGVLLVDVGAGRIHEVAFPQEAPDAEA